VTDFGRTRAASAASRFMTATAQNGAKHVRSCRIDGMGACRSLAGEYIDETQHRFGVVDVELDLRHSEDLPASFRERTPATAMPVDVLCTVSEEGNPAAAAIRFAGDLKHFNDPSAIRPIPCCDTSKAAWREEAGPAPVRQGCRGTATASRLRP
jgi:hypothetical protein